MTDRQLPSRLEGGMVPRSPAQLALGVAREVADRVWFMDHGRLREIGTPGRFFSNPQNNRAQKFLSDPRSH
jgi:ABC-type histidine transport system ATPase subunit